MLIPQLSKTVISRYKEIVAADAVLLPERRTMRSNPTSHQSPDHLSLVRKSLPGLDCTFMQFRLLQLFCSPGKI